MTYASLKKKYQLVIKWEGKWGIEKMPLFTISIIRIIFTLKKFHVLEFFLITYLRSFFHNFLLFQRFYRLCVLGFLVAIFQILPSHFTIIFPVENSWLRSRWHILFCKIRSLDLEEELIIERND